MKVKWKNQWITDYITQVTWSGSAAQCARTMEMSVLCNPYDKRFHQISIKLGDILYLYEESKRIFVGEVTTISRKNGIGSYDVVAADVMNHLLKSKTTRNFRNTCPEKVARAICQELGIKIKNLEKTNVNIAKYYPREETPYNIIVGAYRKASRETKQKYMLIMDGTSLSIIAKGEDSGIILKENETLLSSSFENTLDQMVNKVVIYSEKGQKKDTISKDKWTKQYGIYQEVYTKESGVNAKTAAEALLHGIDKTASVEAIGDIRAVSGKAIRIKDKGSGLTGKFWIENDTHTWANGVHKMSLDLVFKNIMESVNVSEETEKAAVNEKSNKDRVPDVVSIAKKYIGKVKYVFGASSPDSGKSDCSGFTQACYKKAGISIGRTTNDQVKKGKQIDKSDMKQGDLVFFKGTYNSGYSYRVSHVGIYIGNNSFIHCSSSGGVKTNSLTGYYTAHWLMARRVTE